MSPRAPALPAAERRRVLVEATLPLLRERGARVSTAEIARAAGVAEGTIFRVFANKDELLAASIEYAMDPEPMLAELAAIDTARPLAERLEAVVAIWQRRVRDISVLMMAMYASGDGSPVQPRHRSHAEHKAHNDQLVTAIAAVIGDDADQLTLDATAAASLLRSLAFATSHPMISDEAITDPHTIVQIMLHGILTQERSC
ncbi:TetR/AcrR family transcriptional regulator [Enemella evansiae]|uniref:TetR/AcrR family transcriptional regulator n=1 Tax=Enemella evansiae TaxID=2016499 RepID=UPI00155249A7|nr:TetR/AcrR family transcriptional regulator [Enemella evansiae]